MKTFLKKRTGGQAMIMATVFFVFISTTIILGISTMVAGSKNLTNQVLNSRKSLYVAEAGLESALYDALHGVTNPVPSIDGQQAEVEISGSGSETILTASATVGGVVRVVEARLSVGSTTEIVGWKETD
jgi:hypothetical protein